MWRWRKKDGGQGKKKVNISSSESTATFILCTIHCFQLCKEASLDPPSSTLPSCSKFLSALVYFKPSNQSSCLHRKHNFTLKQEFSRIYVEKFGVFLHYRNKEIRKIALSALIMFTFTRKNFRREGDSI